MNSTGKSAVARKIALQKQSQLQHEVNSQSDTDLSNMLSKKRNPFADSDESSEDDLVDISDLPPIPQKSSEKPKLHPKQKINKTESFVRRIDKAMLAKYKSESQKHLEKIDDEDYEDLPTESNQNSTIEHDVFDYDEPIPHSKVHNLL